jgi:hypothetical protein
VNKPTIEKAQAYLIVRSRHDAIISILQNKRLNDIEKSILIQDRIIDSIIDYPTLN